MKNAFTEEEVSLILDLLDDINEDHSLSFLYSHLGHDRYSQWFEIVYDKLESYSPLTPWSLKEVSIISDALRTLDKYEDSELDRDTLSVLNSTCKKTEKLLAALSRGLK